MPTPSTGHVLWFGRQVETDPRLPQPPEDLPFEDTVLARGGTRRRPPKPSGARVTAVDNFQGEESRVVLLSLVRSNQQGRIGYLKEANRVCVALSRAKEGKQVHYMRLANRVCLSSAVRRKVSIATT